MDPKESDKERSCETTLTVTKGKFKETFISKKRGKKESILAVKLEFLTSTSLDKVKSLKRKRGKLLFVNIIIYFLFNSFQESSRERNTNTKRQHLSNENLNSQDSLVALRSDWSERTIYSFHGDLNGIPELRLESVPDQLVADKATAKISTEGLFLIKS